MDDEKGMPFLKVNRFEVEENAVFLDFTPQQMNKNLQNFKTLNLYVRKSLAKNIEAIRQLCSAPQIYHTFLIDLASDIEQIQQQLLDFLKQTFLRQNYQFQYHKQFIEPLFQLIRGTHLAIKEESGILLTQICHKLSQVERMEVVKLAVELQKNQDEENKLISTQLIAKMSPDMTSQQAQTFFKNEFVKIYKQSSVRLKKQIIHSSCLIAKNVSKQFLNQEIIINFFMEKAKEPVWGVRKACVEVLPQLVILTQTNKELLANLLLHLTKDGNKIVKIAAFKIIPEFIANYNSHKVPEKLIQLYIGLIDHEINHSVNRQLEIVTKVAFYFPGVMFTLGAGRWQQMKKLFNRLISFKNNEIKMPLASSLHEISRIIGAELSKEYMFTALDNILKDHSDTLKLSAIAHLSEFVQLFEKNTRQNLIDVFLVLQKDPKKWRVRYEIAHQLNTLSKIYETETVFKYIFPISLKLCNDNVSEVRMEAALQMFNVIDNLKENEMFQEMALESIKGYGLSQKYIQRETFSVMVRHLYKLKNFSQCLELLEKLSRDSIVLVRIALAVSIKGVIDESPEQRQHFQRIIDVFKEDQPDVNEYFIE